MYETFYGCEKTPFTRTIDSALLAALICPIALTDRKELASWGLHLSAAGTKRDIFSEAEPCLPGKEKTGPKQARPTRYR
jgi:hypothetical protein